ncbi:MAG: thioredoxin [Candidatus Peregrinibacteria bacterium]
MSSPVTDASFATEVLQSKIPVLVDFWAPWCGPCRAMGPVVDELATAYEGRVKVMKMNVDENAEMPQQFNVMSIPMFILFKDGSPVSSFVGVRSQADIEAEFQKALS